MQNSEIAVLNMRKHFCTDSYQQIEGHIMRFVSTRTHVQHLYASLTESHRSRTSGLWTADCRGNGVSQ